MRDGFLDVRDTPVGHGAALARLATPRIGIETKLEPADVETDVERLVEVRFNAEGRAVPSLRAIQIGHVIDHGSQTHNHVCPLHSITPSPLHFPGSQCSSMRPT